MNDYNPLRRLGAALALSILATSATAATTVLPSAQDGLAWQPALRIAAPAVDSAALRAYEEQPKLGQPLRYGVVQRLDRVLVASGRPASGAWESLPNGRSVLRIEMTSPAAVSLDAALSSRGLPASAEIYLADAQGNNVLGPIRNDNRSGDGRFYTPLLPGDVARLEIVVDSAERDQVSLSIDSVTHAYRGLFGLEDQAGILSGSCNVDVACPLGNGWTDQIDSVGQYIFTTAQGSFVCTGSLVANTSGNPVPYFLTANHCVSTATVANTVRIYWNYQSPTCRAPGSAASGSSLPRPSTFTAGSILRGNYAASDFSLLELNAAVPSSEHPFFAGWDRRDQGVSGAFSIHHPSGHEKRISETTQALPVTGYLSNTVNSAATHLRIIEWASGTTEGGSSGSALFSPEKRIIGQLHGGYASCASNTSDWYGRIASSWTGGGTAASRLSDWLDPTGLGATTYDGYRASEVIFKHGFDSTP